MKKLTIFSSDLLATPRPPSAVRNRGLDHPPGCIVFVGVHPRRFSIATFVVRLTVLELPSIHPFWPTSPFDLRDPGAPSFSSYFSITGLTFATFVGGSGGILGALRKTWRYHRESHLYKSRL